MELLIRLMRVLWYMDCAGVVLVLLRLIYLQIPKRYPALFLLLALDLVGGVVGLSYGTRSLVYYWTYFVATNLLGSALLIWMCREMFVELYRYHPGLPGLTRWALRRSILIGASGALVVAPPVGLLHWGNPQYQCWQFPFVELHRCLSFGVALFVVTMWRKLRVLPLVITRNVETYTWWAFFNVTSSGLVETATLAIHQRLATRILSVYLLATSLALYGLLALRLERPHEIPQPVALRVDPQEVAWLSSISILFDRVEEAQRRSCTSPLKRLPLFALLCIASCQSAWRVCVRAGSMILGQKE